MTGHAVDVTPLLKGLELVLSDIRTQVATGAPLSPQTAAEWRRGIRMTKGLLTVLDDLIERHTSRSSS